MKDGTGGLILAWVGGLLSLLAVGFGILWSVYRRRKENAVRDGSSSERSS
ncbi:MAG: hypothetical protein Q7R85_02570 [bacterium]|nr:hypothetical protein [bacterium]